MVTTFMELGGVKRPVRFAYEGLFAYEQATGRNALSDFAAFETSAPSVTFLVNIAYSGLYAGYRKEKIPIDFVAEDVAEWIGDDPEVMNKIMELFAASFPTAEKKKTPRQTTAKIGN